MTGRLKCACTRPPHTCHPTVPLHTPPTYVIVSRPSAIRGSPKSQRAHQPLQRLGERPQGRNPTGEDGRRGAGEAGAFVFSSWVPCRQLPRRFSALCVLDLAARTVCKSPGDPSQPGFFAGGCLDQVPNPSHLNRSLASKCRHAGGWGFNV